MKFVLPKLLLLGLVEEGELANMVYEDVAQEWKLRVNGRHFSELGLEGGAESSQGGRRVKLRDLPVHLFRDEFSLEICVVASRAVLVLLMYPSVTRLVAIV